MSRRLHARCRARLALLALVPVLTSCGADEVLPVDAGGRARLEVARLAAEETMAKATLRNLVAAQAQLQVVGWIDTDQDGVGEYGGLLELSGAVAGRGHEALTPAVIGEAFRTLDAEGRAHFEGYTYRLFLPGRKGIAVGEPAGGFTRAMRVPADAAEQVWACLAWPSTAGTQQRSFFVATSGQLLATAPGRHGGDQGAPPAPVFEGLEARPGGDGSSATWTTLE